MVQAGLKAVEKGRAEQIIRITGNVLADVDYEFANLFITPLAGIVVVEMAPVPESTGEIMIAGSEGNKWRQRPDFGTVLAAGSDIDPHQCKPGDIVIVDHEHGKRVSGAVFGQYEAKEEVRVYGRCMQSGGHVLRVPWEKSILGRLVQLPSAEKKEELIIRPSGKWILVCRDGLFDVSDGGIVLPDAEHSRPSKGTVLAAGPNVGVGMTPDGPKRHYRIKRGDRVMYMAGGVKQVQCPGVDDRRLAWLDEDLILLFQEGEDLTEEELAALPKAKEQHHPYDDLPCEE